MISISKNGISVTYKCYNLKYSIIPFHKKCPDYATNKCFTCKYGKAEMSAYDATKLLNLTKKAYEGNKEVGNDKK